jgi:hypothetical protein
MPTFNGFITGSCNNTTPLVITVPTAAQNSSILIDLWLATPDYTASGSAVTILNDELVIWWSGYQWNVTNKGNFGTNYLDPSLNTVYQSDTNYLPYYVTGVCISSNQSAFVTLTCFYIFTYST